MIRLQAGDLKENLDFGPIFRNRNKIVTLAICASSVLILIKAETLKRHLQNFHPDANQILLNELDRKCKKNLQITDFASGTKDDQIQKALIHLFTYHPIPLHSTDTSEFKNLWNL